MGGPGTHLGRLLARRVGGRPGAGCVAGVHLHPLNPGSVGGGRLPPPGRRISGGAGVQNRRLLRRRGCGGRIPHTAAAGVLPRILPGRGRAGRGSILHAAPAGGPLQVLEPLPVCRQQKLALGLVRGIPLQQVYAPLQEPPLGALRGVPGPPNQRGCGHAGHSAKCYDYLLHLGVPLDPRVLSDLGVGKAAAGAPVVPLVERVLAAATAPYVSLFSGKLALGGGSLYHGPSPSWRVAGIS